MLNGCSPDLPLRCAIVMQAVQAQLLNACEWLRITTAWSATISGDGHLGTGSVPRGWKGFVSFKASAHGVIPFADFLDTIACAGGLSKCYGMSEHDRRRGGRRASPVAARANTPPAMARVGGAADAPARAGAASSARTPCAAPRAGAAAMAGPMYSAYTPGPAYSGRDKYYFATVAEVAAAVEARDSVGWKWRWYSQGSHHANVIRYGVAPLTSLAA